MSRTIVELSLATGVAPQHIADLMENDFRSFVTMIDLVDKSNQEASKGKPSGPGNGPSRYGSAQMSG